MAKTIKFNLILDESPVRNLEGIQEHFSIEDILKYFRNGLLERWLRVRGYDTQLEAIKEIDPDDDNKSIIKKLIRIFDISIDNADIEKGISILDYLEEARILNAEYKKNAFEKKRIIDDYHTGYNALIDHMEENKENMAVLKSDAIEMEKEYFGLFDLDFRELYMRIANSVPKAVFAILTRKAFRPYFIGEKADAAIYSHIKNQLLPAAKLKEILNDDLIIVKRNTQAMWDLIERPEDKIMVLRIQDGAFVKNAGVFSEKLSSKDINGQFLILNGLEYQCNNESYELLYMEV